MRVEVVPVMSDNFAYLVICEETGEAAAVDPADPGPVLARAEKVGVRITDLWNTHHHFDHIGGNASLKQDDPKLRHMGHRKDRGRIRGLTHKLRHGDSFGLGALQVEALHTPGHTGGAVCYFVGGEALFTGDTLFGGGCGRLFEGEPATMLHSLMEVIAPLPPATRLYFGHEYTLTNLDFALTVEPENQRLRQRVERVREQMEAGQPTTPSTLEEELASNPFLRPGSAEIRAVLAQKFPGDEWTDLQVFTRLREMRNSW